MKEIKTDEFIILIGLINKYGFKFTEDSDTYYIIQNDCIYATVGRKRMFEMNTSYEHFEQMKDQRVKNIIYNCCDGLCCIPTDKRSDEWNKAVDEWLELNGNR